MKRQEWVLTGWEKARSVKQFIFTYLVRSEKYIILSEVKTVLSSAIVSVMERLHRRKALSEIFLARLK